MAIFTGQNGVVKLVTSGGTVAAATHVRSYTISQAADTIETTAMGATSNYRTYVAGLKSFSISVDMYWDDSNAAQQDMIEVGTVLDFELYPEGDSTVTKFSGSVICTQADITASFDGMTEFTFAGSGDSALTITTS